MLCFRAEDFTTWAEKKKPSLPPDQAAILDEYTPSLTPREQQLMLFTALSATQVPDVSLYLSLSLSVCLSLSLSLSLFLSFSFSFSFSFSLSLFLFLMM